MKQHLQAALAALTEAQLHLERAETARQFSTGPTYTHLRSLQPALERRVDRLEKRIDYAHNRIDRIYGVSRSQLER